jgi:prepilin-type N-terminal cleavage/methylation domain-containing protein
MLPSSRQRTAGFTLVELLTVIAIIGILAAIFIPTMGSAMDKAKRTVDQTNMREMVKAATIYAQDNDGHLPDPATVPTTTLTATQRALLWPGVLAKNGILTDPKTYFSKLDVNYDSRNPPLSIINTTDVNKRSLDNSFVGKSLAVEMVGGLRSSDTPTTPIVYTRGLGTAGTWNINSGVYKDTGGFIGFLGGNVEFYANTGTANTNTAVFTSNNSGRKIANVQQAIPFTPNQARIYGVPPAGSTILGSVNGTASQRGP